MQPRVTIFVPFSRIEMADRFFARLELMPCDHAKTNLLVMVDGSPELFVKVRNLVTQSKFEQKLCVQFVSKKKQSKYNKQYRRERIAQINNEAKKYMWDCDYILGLEDDTIFPTNTTRTLLKHYLANPYAGMIEGLELGRWGVPYIGAWKVDSIYEPTEVSSIMIDQSKKLQEIDAGGFYCYMTRADDYMTHEFEPWADGNLGPDVNYGIALRKKGYKNYIDTSLVCEHFNELTGDSISPKNSNILQIKLKKQGTKWKYVNS